jgi:hypothetical protein
MLNEIFDADWLEPRGAGAGAFGRKKVRRRPRRRNDLNNFSPSTVASSLQLLSGQGSISQRLACLYHGTLTVLELNIRAEFTASPSAARFSHIWLIAMISS